MNSRSSFTEISSRSISSKPFPSSQLLESHPAPFVRSSSYPGQSTTVHVLPRLFNILCSALDMSYTKSPPVLKPKESISTTSLFAATSLGKLTKAAKARSSCSIEMPRQPITPHISYSCSSHQYISRSPAWQASLISKVNSPSAHPPPFPHPFHLQRPHRWKSTFRTSRHLPFRPLNSTLPFFPQIRKQAEGTHPKHAHRPDNALVLLRRQRRIGQFQVCARSIGFGS